MHHEDGALFTFQPISAGITAFDKVKVRATRDKRWTGHSLIIQARVSRVGVVTFTFGVKPGSDTGELLWGTTSPVWPPKNGTDRVRIVKDVKKVVVECLRLFPDLEIDPSAVNCTESLSTVYEVTGSIPPAPDPQPRTKAPEDVRIKELGPHQPRAESRDDPQDLT